MSGESVKHIAQKIQISVVELLADIKASGLPHTSENQALSLEDKKVLINYLMK